MSKKVPADAKIDEVETAKDIFEGLKPASGASIVLVHVKPGGNDAGDGISWSTAKGTVGAALSAVSGESANNVHLILLASGTYRPASTLAMKNHVAIIGGFGASADDGVGYYRGGATEISGNDKIQVFRNNNLDTKNAKSTAVLARLTVTGGKAAEGGGMLNGSSSPTVTHATFSRNTATNGGGMYNENSGPKIASSIFWESAFYNTNNSGNTAAPVVAHSIIQGGYTGGTDIITPAGSPFSGALGDNRGFVETIPIGSDSEARDKGLYFARKGTTFYYSTDDSTWYTTPKASGTAAALPADAQRYTTDARGYSHNGRPDMGAYEHGGTAP